MGVPQWNVKLIITRQIKLCREDDKKKKKKKQIIDMVDTYATNKHLKKSNAACFYTPIVLKL